jgi:ABC-type sugar transport system permease subunit
MSFTNYNLLTIKKTRIIGLENYAKILFEDPEFWHIFLFSLVYTLSIVIFSYIFGFLIALLLNKPMKGRGIFRAIILIPWVISTAIMASNWKWLLNDEFGLVNGVLQSLGVISKPIRFFATAGWARFSVCAIGVWRNLPFMAITLLAGLQGIPNELYEAAIVDGATKWQSFWKITIPYMRSTTLISTTLLFIWAFNGFENIYLLTDGGPVNSTMVVPIYAFKMAFNSSRMGYASALSILLMVIMVIVSLVRMKLSKNQDI